MWKKVIAQAKMVRPQNGSLVRAMVCEYATLNHTRVEPCDFPLACLFAERLRESLELDNRRDKVCVAVASNLVDFDLRGERFAEARVYIYSPHTARDAGGR
jgi:hypothetical protein